MSVAETNDAASRLQALMTRTPVIPVYSPGAADDVVGLARALLRGGVDVIEVTLRSAGALERLREIATAVPDMIVGAGTVLDPAQMQAALAAGARFIVAPGSTPELLDAAAAGDVALLPGIATASELMSGIARGRRHFKFFPAAYTGGPALLSAFAGPFPDVRFCPTGGISPATAPDYLRLANVLCIGGSWLTPATAVAARDWSQIEALARASTQLPRG